MKIYHLPYYAVIFTSTQTEDLEGYKEMAMDMERLAKQQEGFLGLESSRTDVGITVSYWQDEKAIVNWKKQCDHLIAQQKGRNQWYQLYKVEVCKVERAYIFEKDADH